MGEESMVPPRQLDASPLSAELSSRLFWRIVPLLFVVYVFNYIDRANVGFAALQMNASLGFGPQLYGMGAGIFFIGYLLLTIPANLLVLKLGARTALAGMAICWGLVAMAMALVRDAPTFFVIRFVLGMTEAGFAPALTLYVSQWFPSRERGRALGGLATATYFSIIIGGPLSGEILELPAWLGVAPWQWLFILEGLPAVLLGFVLWRFLVNRPEEADWLTDAQRRELLAALSQETGSGVARNDIRAALRTGRLWGLFVVFFCCGLGFFALILWLPQIIDQLLRVRPLHVGLIAAVPFLLCAIAAAAGGWLSDQTGRRYRYVVVGTLLASLGFAASALLIHDAMSAVIALTLGAVALNSIIGPFWSVATALLRGEAAALGIALINAGGVLGGFAGAVGLGRLREQSGNFASGLLIIAASLALAAVLTAIMARGAETEPARSPMLNRA
jgi:MFS transporter, ACS family, tartrate transporter